MSREDIIWGWMLSTLQSGGIERFDDLHVGDIDRDWAGRDSWVKAGLEALRIAAGLRDRNHCEIDIALAFSLHSGEGRRGIDFRNEVEFAARLDWSPPSLYLLNPGTRPWDRGPFSDDAPSELAVQPLDPTILGVVLATKGCYLLEFKPPQSPEYSRTVSVIA